MNFARCCTGAPEENAAATEKEPWELRGGYHWGFWGVGLSKDVSVDTRRELIFDEPSWWDANVDPAEDLERYEAVVWDRFGHFPRGVGSVWENAAQRARSYASVAWTLGELAARADPARRP